MPTYLLTWNPLRWNWEQLPKVAKRVQAGRLVRDRWSCARSHQIQKGDRLFILRQRSEPRGIFGSGWATSNAFPDDHWDANSESPTSMYVRLRFDALLDPDSEPILPRKDLDRGVLGHAHWDTQASGILLPDVTAEELENVWANFVGSRFPSIGQGGRGQAVRNSLRRHGAGFGTPERNALVERAAVELVTKTYRLTGWTVQSVERDKCGFDLRCSKGKVVQEVEVKGVTGSVEGFLITVGEVAQAKSNPRFVICVVTEALSDHAHATSYSGKEFLRRFTLAPVQFAARIRPEMVG